MLLIDAASAADYLRSTGRVAAGEPVEAQELAGGVSNIVLLITLPSRGERFILKQARQRLRVKEEWLCPPQRILREVEVLRLCGELLASQAAGTAEIVAHVPTLLWEDRPNLLYAMSAAPAEHVTWKQRLLSGDAELERPVATACGHLLATLHGQSWRNATIAAPLADQTYFDQLRLDPYYRHLARVYPELSPHIERLLESLAANCVALVHGDYSPKNLLVWPGHVMLIDFEVGHYGDPAFDLGFFLTHLVLKSVWAGSRSPVYRQLACDFWQAYHDHLTRYVSRSETAAVEERAVLNLAGCMLARIDGKSPVDYLTPEQQASVRALAKEWLQQPPDSLAAAVGHLAM
jgi:aminoglycoside phosphotransferase (APT) family kinase protein